MPEALEYHNSWSWCLPDSEKGPGKTYRWLASQIKSFVLLSCWRLSIVQRREACCAGTCTSFTAIQSCKLSERSQQQLWAESCTRELHNGVCTTAKPWAALSSQRGFISPWQAMIIWSNFEHLMSKSPWYAYLLYCLIICTEHLTEQLAALK